MLKKSYPYYLANRPVAANRGLEVVNKYTGKVATRVALADGGTLSEAIGCAHDAEAALRRMPAHARAAVLHHLVDAMSAHHQELAEALCIEAGKPIKDSRVEITRAIDTVRIAAEEAVRMYGEYLPLDISPRAESFQAITKRVPVGVCSFITPFNFPINLVAHKIAPAIAVGCPWVLKPASATPVGALLLGEMLAETELPRGAFSILPCRGKDAAPLVEDDRVKKISFTGSADVGWEIKARAGKKHVTLELGGNAAAIVDADADLDYTTQRLTVGAFYQSGQSCISVGPSPAPPPPTTRRPSPGGGRRGRPPPPAAGPASSAAPSARAPSTPPRSWTT